MADYFEKPPCGEQKESKFKSPGIFVRDGLNETQRLNSHELKICAIEFAKYVSNHQVLDDFWAMSAEAQEEVYNQYLSE